MLCQPPRMLSRAMSRCVMLCCVPCSVVAKWAHLLLTTRLCGVSVDRGPFMLLALTLRCAVSCCVMLCAVFRAVLSPRGRVSFSPPGCVVYQYDLGPFMLQNDLLAVPAGPGRSVAYTLGMSNAPKVSNLDILKTLFTNPKQLMPTLFR
jgi:hypothetical protein